ncbi:MAG TPA: VWA domain-containing protein [Anaerolineae bacterium]|nr:VWA domain-containing protein [Anaerolineae bacterium]
MSYDFAQPAFLLLLFLLPLIWIWEWWAEYEEMPTLRYTALALLPKESFSWRLALRPWPRWLRWIVISLFIVALARPQAATAQYIINGEGIDIVLALDISGSMEERDFDVFGPSTRLDVAKDVIAEFIDEREFDRLGLVVFASEAFAQSPLTVDHDVLKRLLGRTEIAPRAIDGTAIGLGLAQAANMLKDSEGESKIVILLTDGVNNSGQIDPLTAAEAAEALGIKVYTIGAGRPNFGRVPLDEESLRTIAERTGGRYFRATDSTGLRNVYDEINELETSEIEVRVYNQYEELAGWLLWPALFLLLLSFWLEKTIVRSFP